MTLANGQIVCRRYRVREMQGRLQHPNLPRVTDHFYKPDQGQKLVMDFVEGHDLREVVARVGRPSARRWQC